MNEKEIKIKPKDFPKGVPSKIVIKSKDVVVNAAKDAGAVAKDAILQKTVKTKHGLDTTEEQPQKADTEATESVESAAYTTVVTAYHKGKTYAKNRIREHRANKAKSRETAENNMPELPEEKSDVSKELKNPSATKERQEPTAETGGEQKRVGVKTKEEYLKSQDKKQGKADSIKMKENHLKEHDGDGMCSGVKEHKPTSTPKTKDSVHYADGKVEPKTAQEARREYVEAKLKRKEKANAEELPESNAPKMGDGSGNQPKISGLCDDKSSVAEAPREKSQVKSKESYMHSLHQERVEPRQTVSRKPKEKTANVGRSTINAPKGLKTRENVVGKSNSIVKSGNAYASKTSKKKTAKTAKRVAKTQKEITKEAAKEAAKTAAIKTAKAVAVIGKAVAAAVTKAATAFFAAFGWIGVAILLVILIVICIVAAIAASPFGIFLSDEAAGQNGIPVSSIIAECNAELSQKLTEIEDHTPHNRIVMEGGQADWGLVLSVFAVRMAGTGDNTAQDVVVIDDAKKQKLKEVFWDMYTISSRTGTVSNGNTSETVLYITITAKTKDEMILQYGFNAKQKEALETLLANADGFIGATRSLAISDATAQEIINALPEGLPEARKSVVKKACSLVGKVNYFWGGKSSAVGWDPEWGRMKLVTAEGSRSSGSMRPFGLDCSGFVTWAFYNAGFSESAIGHGTNTQASNGTRIALASAEPGDLAFLGDLSHVGIVGGRDASGNVLIIHCSSGANNVVISAGGFDFAVRPNCY